MTSRPSVPILIATVIFLQAWVERAHASPAGLWLTQGRDAKIRVSSCGKALCGVIAWLRDPIDSETGRPATDKLNPDPSKRARSLIGVHLFVGMRPSGPGRWSGHIYNAQDGQTYRGGVVVRGPTGLQVEGCLLAFCGSEVWTRAR